MKKNNPSGSFVRYVITYTTRIHPHCEDKEIQCSKRVANMRFKELSKNYFYIKMVKETVTYKIVKQTSL